MAGTEIRTVTRRRTVSRFYRRPPGFGWLVAVAAIPLLLAVLGQAIADRSRIEAGGPSLTLPAAPQISADAGAPPTVAPPGLSLAPLSILRNGSVATLNGDLPDIGTRTALIDMLKGMFGDGVRLVDNLTIKPGVTAPSLSSLGAVLKAGLSMPDFKFQINGDTITLMSAAASDPVKSAVEAAAQAAWPNLKIANEIRLSAAAPEAPSPPPSPAPGPAGDCGSLQTDITALMSSPVTFVTNGFKLTAGAQEQLSRVAAKVKGCNDARLAVNGYTDDTGNDAINIPLSRNRAKAVADFLAAHGVPADHVTAQGLGSADPVASNATADGRAQNRRVAIVVG